MPMRLPSTPSAPALARTKRTPAVMSCSAHGCLPLRPSRKRIGRHTGAGREWRRCRQAGTAPFFALVSMLCTIGPTP